MPVWLRHLEDRLRLHDRDRVQDVPRPEKEHYRTADGDTLDGKCEGGNLMDEDLCYASVVRLASEPRMTLSVLRPTFRLGL